MNKESLERFELRSAEFTQILDDKLEKAMEDWEGPWKSAKLELSEYFKKVGDYDRAFLLMATEEATTVQDLKDFNQEYLNHKDAHRESELQKIEECRAVIKAKEEEIHEIETFMPSTNSSLIGLWSDPVWRLIEIKELPAYLEEFPITDTLQEDVSKLFKGSTDPFVEGKSKAEEYTNQLRDAAREAKNAAEYSPEPEVDTLDRLDVLDSDSEGYVPMWMYNTTPGNVSITGVTGKQWLVLEGSTPFVMTEDEFKEFALSEDVKALELRGKLKIVDESFLKADAFLTDKLSGVISSL